MMVDQRVSGANIVTKARIKDLEIAKDIIVNAKRHTPDEVSAAKSLISRFKSGCRTDEQFITAVDDYGTANMTYEMDPNIFLQLKLECHLQQFQSFQIFQHSIQLNTKV